MFRNYLLNCGILNFHKVIMTHNAFYAKHGSVHVQDPGLHRRRKMFKGEDRLEDIEDIEDIEGMESDFSDAHQSIAELERENYRRRAHIGRKITINKFFTGPKPPSMLTWAERLEIKRLHKKDPEEWNLDVLSECFPAPRETISKILKAKWVPESLHKMKKRDAVVIENWKRLEEGKLDAEPQLLEHLKKFVGRREEYLSALNDEDLSRLLPKPPPERRWNQGRMSSILESYEKKLLALTKEREEEPAEDVREVTSGDQPELFLNGPQVNNCVVPSSEKEQPNIDQNTKIEASLGSKRHVTLAELRRELRLKSDVTENSTIEDNYNVKSSQQEYPTEKSSAEDLECHLDRRLLAKPGELSSTVETMIDPLKTLRSSVKDRVRKVSKSKTAVISNYEQKNELERDEFKEESSSLAENLSNQVGILDTVRKVANPQTAVVSNYEHKNELKRNEFKQESSSLVGNLNNQAGILDGARKVSNPQTAVVSNYEYKNELERKEFEQEEQSIEGTFFWPSQADSLEIQKSVVNPVSFKGKAHSFKVPSSTTGYPLRINIPIDKRGKGLTFQVEDRFYDDDGEFLYRVPGMTAK